MWRQNSNGAEWVRVCQDEEGNRKACERLVCKCYNLKEPPPRLSKKRRQVVYKSKSEKIGHAIANLVNALDNPTIPAAAKMGMQIKLANLQAEFEDALQDEKEAKAKATVTAHTIVNPVIIDRCNFDVSQRKTWVELAKAAKIPVERRVCVVIGTPLATCSERATMRISHPTLGSDVAASVVHRVARDFVFPTLDEGFGRISVLNPAGTWTYYHQY